MENKIGRETPPPITHPEYFYGFLGAGLAWQILFLVLSRDPLKYRAMILPSIVEKASYGIALAVLFTQHRLRFPFSKSAPPTGFSPHFSSLLISKQDRIALRFDPYSFILLPSIPLRSFILIMVSINYNYKVFKMTRRQCAGFSLPGSGLA